MTDYFALLGESRAAWLDADRLKEKFHQRARTEHPDAGGTSFQELNAAYRVLADPKLRVAHLLELNGAPAPAIRQPPPELVDMFFATANALKASPAQIEAQLQRITSERDRVIDSLHTLDTRDNRQLADAHQRLAFFDRWIAQLNDALV